MTIHAFVLLEKGSQTKGCTEYIKINNIPVRTLYNKTRMYKYAGTITIH